MMATSKPEPNPNGIVRVGAGRGFVLEGPRGRYVITAAHCLPKLPPATLGAYTEELTYRSLLGPLGKKPKIWAECLFVDPLSDVAVLGAVDNQKLGEQAEAYEAMLEALPPFPVADVPVRGEVWLYALDGRWFSAEVSRLPGSRGFYLTGTAEAIRGGMSGSPIRLASGKAIGVVSTSMGSAGEEDHREACGIALTRALPVWLVRELRHPVRGCLLCGLDTWHRDPAECIQALRTRADALEKQERAEGGG
jgi:hypothetical protein